MRVLPWGWGLVLRARMVRGGEGEGARVDGARVEGARVEGSRVEGSRVARVLDEDTEWVRVEDA